MSLDEELYDECESEGSIGKDLMLVLGGAMIGAAVALLYAPQTGDKARKKIVKRCEKAVNRARKFGDEVADRVEDLRVVVGQQIEEGAEYVGERKEEFLDSVNSLQEKLSDLRARVV